jgi:DNA-binding NarL/FixJ family response regulator
MKKSKLTILIVDDNKGYTKRIASLLTDTKNVSTIDLAYNYEEATVLLDREPDLVLLDINLPGQNGISLLKQIKHSGNSCNVIMMTNHTGDHYREECKKLGANFFLDKTHDFELLPEILGTLSN